MTGQPTCLTDRSTETVDRDGRPARTDGRTDERTESPTRDVTISLLSDAHARVQADDDTWVSLGDVLAAGFMPTGSRFPVVRTGERHLIPWHIRSAVWYRDRGRCQLCKTERPKPWHLDHIVPWSAGGTDTTENLRVLCEPCNVERSNYDDRNTYAKRPVTWWCHRCYGPTHDWRYGDTTIACGARGPYSWHTRCRVQALYALEVERGEAPTWHQREPVVDADLIAYCAHCNAPSLTDVTL